MLGEAYGRSLPLPYEARTYREWISSDEAAGLRTFQVALRETDLQIRARRDLTSRAFNLLRRARKEIETYASVHPEFLHSMSPLPIPADCEGTPLQMLRTGLKYDVGPMAAVAGAVAEAVGRGLLAYTPEVIVENGGDIFLRLGRPAKLALYGGTGSPFSGRLVIEVGGDSGPLGVCTSSGTVGHSSSLGRADAVVAVADSASLADAAATALANRVRGPEDVERVINEEKERKILRGMVVVIGSSLGAWGDLRLHRL